jgi:hypothetical protein
MKASFVISLCLFATCTCYSQFKVGRYYTSDGKKVNGLLHLSFRSDLAAKSDGNCDITFKTHDRGEKVKLTTKDIIGFVIERDSFAIVRNLPLNPFASDAVDFAEVLESGKIMLYNYYNPAKNMNGTLVSSSIITVTFIEKDGKLEKLYSRSFKTVLREFIADYPELAKKVDDKILRYDHAREIIKIYNKHFPK